MWQWDLPVVPDRAGMQVTVTGMPRQIPMRSGAPMSSQEIDTAYLRCCGDVKSRKFPLMVRRKSDNCRSAAATW